MLTFTLTGLPRLVALCQTLLRKINDIFSGKVLSILVCDLGYTRVNIYQVDGLVWFVWFYGISTFVGYLTPNLFLCK